MKTMTIVRRALLAAVVLFPGASPAAAPYDDHTTHVTLITRAIDLAAPGGYPEILVYRDTIKEGAVLEDSGSPIMRFANHFFDPKTGLGMPRNSYTIVYEANPSALLGGTRYPSAYDWGLNGMPDHRDWEGAINEYGYGSNYKAYLALGHVVHLLQDMAQPDHAACRPHPGGYAHAMLAGEAAGWQHGTRKQAAEYFVPEDRIGYEALWKYKNAEWPRGKVVKKPRDLKDAFVTMATEAQDTEKALGLLHFPPEVALGLRSYRSARADPGGEGRERTGDILTLVLDSGTTLWRMEQYARFRDDLWLHFELEVPIVPMIPWPPNVETAPYIELGHRLLPIAEERSAGLLQHFHDIVNHPPIVQRVQITQGGEPRYDKPWKEGSPVRTLETAADTGVLLGAEAEIRITFGPFRVNPVLVEPITDIKVFLELEGGEALPIPGKVISGTGENVTWVGSIIPQKFGTLRIEARDSHAHFEGRAQKGDLLDAQPGTYALAKSPAPYNWVGYEPGPDRNHRLSAGTACAVCAAVGRHEKTFVSGTYKGTLTRKHEDAGGMLEDSQAQVTFRCLRVGYPWNRAGQKYALIFGIGSGTYTCKSRPYSGDPLKTFTGGAIEIGGSLELYQECTGKGHEYHVSASFPDVPGRIGGVWVEGIARDGLNVSGEHTDGTGARFTWNLGFTPAPAPPHLAAGGTLDPGMLSSYLSNYAKQAEEALLPAYTRLATAGRAAEIQRLQDRMTEPWNALAAEGEAESRLPGDVQDRYDEAEKAWIYMENKDGPEEKYRAAVPALAAAVARWKAHKKGYEDKIAAATLDVARQIEPVDKEGAQKLRALVEKLKTQGSEAFGDTGR